VPYYITNRPIGCDGWATVKEDGEIIGCHANKDAAIAQMVAVSISEGIEPGGERALPDNYRPSLSEDVPDGRACGNCAFYDETNTQEQEGALVAWCHRWDEYVRGDFYCNAWQEAEESEEEEDEESARELRQVDLSPPEYMRDAARRGLQLYADGEGGDGLQPATVRDAREMAAGRVSESKWRRIGPWIARHIDDLDAVTADQPITPGLVAHLLWGSGPTKSDARRAQEYAENVVMRLDEEQQDRSLKVADRAEPSAIVEGVETRQWVQEFELRQMPNGKTRFTGYAAVFNSDSEPLPFIERIMPGAFDKTLRSRNNVKMYLNHDSTLVLASTRAKTLKLSTDQKGLYTETELPDTSYARDLAVMMERGDVDSMSFGFSVPRNGDRWSEDGATRELREVRLHEVSVVTGFPAYRATSATIRSIDLLAEKTGADANKLAHALTMLENGKELNDDDAALLSEAVTKLRTTPPETPASVSIALKHLELLKHQF
jgi:HK97 family phage prohead protease